MTANLCNRTLYPGWSRYYGFMDMPRFAQVTSEEAYLAERDAFYASLEADAAEEADFLMEDIRNQSIRALLPYIADEAIPMFFSTND